MPFKRLIILLLLIWLTLGIGWLSLVWAAPIEKPQDFPSQVANTGQSLLTVTHQLTKTPPILLKATNYPPIWPPEVPAISQDRSGMVTFNSLDSGSFFFPPYLSENERFGFDKTSGHDTTLLNAGWYIDWAANTNPSRPGGVEYAHHIMFKVDINTPDLCPNLDIHVPVPAQTHSQVFPTLTGTALINAVKLNPGSLWLISNEPDAPYNGHAMQAELYAELYHHYYTTIKATDPLAKVAIGAVSQPSPMRMVYLDRILAHYRATYGVTLPTDLWNIHFYRLREVSCEWGVSNAPFIGGVGWELELTSRDMLSVRGFRRNLSLFREWLRDRGYQNHPLIITEFGVLPRPELGFSNEEAAKFMAEITEMMRTTTDPAIGYPADGHRLVQMWAWFSTRYWNFGGDLFEEDNNNLTVIGEQFVHETSSRVTPYVDLQVISPEQPLVSDNTLQGTAYVQNRGNISSNPASVHISFKDITGQPVTLAEKTVNVGGFPQRYHQKPTPIDFGWDVVFSQTPVETALYRVDMHIPESDANPANNAFSSGPITWWKITDVAVDVVNISGSTAFLYENPTTRDASATIINLSQSTSPETPFQLLLDSPDKSTSRLIDSVIPPLAPGEKHTVTATFLIDKLGYWKVTGSLSAPLGTGADLAANNTKSTGIMAADHFIFLPIVSKN